MSAEGQLEHPSEVNSSTNTGFSEAKTGFRYPIPENTKVRNRRDFTHLDNIIFPHPCLSLLYFMRDFSIHNQSDTANNEIEF
jgi:hypothetical protein